MAQGLQPREREGGNVLRDLLNAFRGHGQFGPDARNHGPRVSIMDHLPDDAVRAEPRGFMVRRQPEDAGDLWFKYIDNRKTA